MKDQYNPLQNPCVTIDKIVFLSIGSSLFVQVHMTQDMSSYCRVKYENPSVTKQKEFGLLQSLHK